MLLPHTQVWISKEKYEKLRRLDTSSTAALNASLQRHSVDTSSWGTAAGTKPVAALRDEVASGAATLTLSAADDAGDPLRGSTQHDASAVTLTSAGQLRPLRTLRVVNVHILSEDGALSLVLSHEERADGTRRESGKPLSKKRRSNERLEDVVARAVGPSEPPRPARAC